MKLESIQEVTELRDRRAAAEELIVLSRVGRLSVPTFLADGGRGSMPVCPTISEEIVRAAVASEAYRVLDVIDDRLRKLGVATVREDKSPPPTVEECERHAEMYRNAWLRSLGGKVKFKAHLIDALVITTEEMRAKADLHSQPVVPKAMHEARVTELLQANNEMEARARTAERKLREFMQGTDADKLRLAVAQAADVVIERIDAIKGARSA